MAPFLGQTLLFPGGWAPNPQLLDSLGISSKARQLSLRTPSRPQQGPDAQAAAGGSLCPSRPHITDRPWGPEWQQQDDQSPQPGAVLWGGSRSSELCLGHLWGHPAESPGQMLLCHCYSVTMRPQSLLSGPWLPSWPNDDAQGPGRSAPCSQGRPCHGSSRPIG